VKVAGAAGSWLGAGIRAEGATPKYRSPWIDWAWTADPLTTPPSSFRHTVPAPVTQP
jgi:hypothetical protein